MGTARRSRPERLPAKLRQIRKFLKFTQEQMADRLNERDFSLQPGHVSRFELGLREPPLTVLLAYARLAEVSTDTLIDDAIDLPKQLD
jgi:transcriptional regulator with XRE-family HTH domain